MVPEENTIVMPAVAVCDSSLDASMRGSPFREAEQLMKMIDARIILRMGDMKDLQRKDELW
jgi:hypothetical protein